MQASLSGSGNSPGFNSNQPGHSGMSPGTAAANQTFLKLGSAVVEPSSNARDSRNSSTAFPALQTQRNAAILDVEISGDYVFVLFEKNLVMGFDLRYSALPKQGDSDQGTKRAASQMSVEELVHFDRPVFKATFADATE